MLMDRRGTCPKARERMEASSHMISKLFKERPAHIGAPGFGASVFSPGDYDFRPGRDPWRARPRRWCGFKKDDWRTNRLNGRRH